MPKEKPFKCDMRAFYKSQTEDIAMFSFVYGVQKFLPAIQTKTLIESFKEYFDLTEDDYPSECAIVNYQTMKAKFLKKDKSE